MWQFALPMVMCACGDENSAVVAIVGIVVVAYLMNVQKRDRSSPPVPFGPSPLPVSARLANTGESEAPTGEESPIVVPNPRRAQTDLLGEEESEVLDTRTHIVGCSRRPSSESRRRLLKSQRQELLLRLHQYE